MNNACELQSVIVSVAPAVSGTISVCLQELGIAAVCYSQPASVLEVLKRQKTDAFFVDQALDPEFAILEAVRTSSSSRGAVDFAVVPQTLSKAMAVRAADFLLHKPLSRTDLSRTLRAAYALMLKERRRYSRYSLESEAIVEDSTSHKFPATITNLSQTGIALATDAQLIAGEIVNLEFRLPQSPKPSRFRGQVIWTAANGRAGLTFTHMGAVDRERLTEWLDGEFLRQWHTVIPQGIATRFLNANH